MNSNGATPYPRRFYGTGLSYIDRDSLKGQLIVIEGPDGSGRSTQVALLRNWLEHNGYPTMQVGLKRSSLVGEHLERVMEGHTLSPLTFCLYYATDFADQLENVIIPALRADFIVLADRYVYTLMARDIVRGADPDWIRDVYGFALVPDAVFYLSVDPPVLAERHLFTKSSLDYWESGMDIRRSGDMYQSFIRYQRQVRRLMDGMRRSYEFQVIDGARPPEMIARELRSKLAKLLRPPPEEGCL
jgi:dTMP kinase